MARLRPRLRRGKHLLLRGLGAQVIGQRLIVDVKLFKRGVAIAHAHCYVSVLFRSLAVFPICFFGCGRILFCHPESVEGKNDTLFLVEEVTDASGPRADWLIRARPNSIRTGRTAKGKLPSGLSAAESDEGNSANQTDSAHDRRKTDSVTLSVLDLKRPQLRVFLFLIPPQAAIGESDNANDDENDADYSSRFHNANATTVAGRQSIG